MRTQLMKEKREQLGLTQAQIAKALGIAANTYSQYESGKRQPDYETLIKIAEILKTSVGHLLSTEVAPALGMASIPLTLAQALLPVKPIPILGHIHAGQPVDSAPDIEGITYITGDVPGDFALIVEGDCMEPQLTEGDLVICQHTNGLKAEAGQIVAALIEGEVCLRRLIWMDERWVLHASNPKYVDIPLQHTDIIQGIVLQVTRKVGLERPSMSNLLEGLSTDQQTAVLNLIRAFQSPKE